MARLNVTSAATVHACRWFTVYFYVVNNDVTWFTIHMMSISGNNLESFLSFTLLKTTANSNFIFPITK